MKFLIFIIVLFALLPIKLEANLILDKVTFHAPPGGYNGWIRLEKDQDALEIISKVNKTVVMEEGVTTNRPVAYVSGYKPRVSAVFKKNNNSLSLGCSSAHIYIRGRWSEAAPNSPPILAPKKLTATLEYLSEPFSIFSQEGEVKAYLTFTIIWECSTNEEGPWTSIASSSNTLYITHKIPVEVGSSNIQALPGQTHFLTSMHYACVEANNQSSPQSIVSSIYGKFKDKCMQKVNGTNCMLFWGPYSTGDTAFDNYRSLRHFLAKEDARCGEWRQFLSDIFSLHGIADHPAGIYGSKPTSVTAYNRILINGSYYTGTLPQNVYNIMKITIEKYFPGLFNSNDPFNANNRVFLPDGLTSGEVEAYFFVNNWAFPRENELYGLWPVNDTLSLNGHLFIGADATGVSAQGTNNPTAYFNNHAILKYNNSYYDPSYGTGPFLNSSEWANESISGFGARIVYKGDDGKLHLMLWLHEKTTTNNHIKFD